MSFAYVLEQIVNGLILGSMYALVAIGFSMIYGIVRLINFAHGEIVMIGAFATFGLVTILHAPFAVDIVIVLIVGAVMGVIVDRAAFKPIRGAPQVTGFIASLAVAILLQNLALMTLSAQPRNFHIPGYLNVVLAFGPVSLRVIELAIIIVSIVLMLLLVAFVRLTKTGIAMRATAENLAVARLMGIHSDRMIMLAFGVGSALAAVAGLMWGALYGQITPLMGFVPGLKAFVAAVIGGVGSITGAMLGGFILGLAEVLFVGLLPPEFSGYRDVFVFTTLIVILLVMPNGLMGHAEERA